MNLPLDAHTAVCEVDLAVRWDDCLLEGRRPLGAPAGRPPSPDTAAALVLVRLHGRPVGYVCVPATDGRVRRDAVVEALLDTHLEAVADVLAATALETGRTAVDDVGTLLRAGARWLADARPAADSPPLVSVAVCTRDRPRDLDRCLTALEALNYPALDLLVVDNAPADGGTAAVVRRHPRVRYVVEPRPGLDWARNRAIADGRGTILAFTDDDVVADPGWVSALVAVFDSDPAVMAVTGLVLPLELDTRAQRLFEVYGGFARGVRRRWYRARPGRPAALELGGAGGFGTGANMAYRRRVFDRIGAFDPALDVGTCTNGGGDLEMFFRVLKHGHTLVYEPSAVVWHRHRRDEQALRAQIASNGIGFYAYLARTAGAYPDERISILRLGLWWFVWWNLRRLVRALSGRERLPLPFVLAELIGSLRGPVRPWRARRQARAAQQRYPGARTVAADPAEPPPVRVLTREAIRTVDLTRPLEPLTGLREYRRVRVFAFLGTVLAGRVVIDNRGADISVLQLRDALVRGLPGQILEGHHPEPDLVLERLRAALRPVLRAPRLGVPASEPNPDLGTRAALPAAPLADALSVSVVLATCDRPDDLRAALASLVAQGTPRRVEIIVVDNHPASGLTPPVAGEFPGVRLLEEPRAGLSYARNRGILAASGDLVLTTDDDAVCPPDWLERLVAPFGRPDVMIVTGNVLPLELETAAQQYFETYGGLGRGFRPREFGSTAFGQSRRSVPTWLLGCTANAAFRSTIFGDPRIGLMDEALGAGTPTGCSEDTYVFYRTLAAGFSIVYEPRAYVWHRHRRTRAALRRQLYSYSKGHVAYHLTTWLADGDRRGLGRLLYELPLTYAQRALLRLLRRSDYPLRFLVLEMLGSLAGPWALWQSRRRVRRLGRSGPIGAPRPLPSGRAVGGEV